MNEQAYKNGSILRNINNNKLYRIKNYYLGVENTDCYLLYTFENNFFGYLNLSKNETIEDCGFTYDKVANLLYDKQI